MPEPTPTNVHPGTSAPASAPPPLTHTPSAALVCPSVAAFASAMRLRTSDALLPRLAQAFSVSLSTASQVVSAFAMSYGADVAAFASSFFLGQSAGVALAGLALGRPERPVGARSGCVRRVGGRRQLCSAAFAEVLA